MKIWIWGPKTSLYNMASVQFFLSSQITPPYCTVQPDSRLYNELADVRWTVHVFYLLT